MNSLTNLTYETYLQELNYENSPTGIHSHLQNLTYKTLPRNTILQKTHLRGLAYDNKPTRTHLPKFPTSRLQKSYLGIHIYKKLNYEDWPTTTNLRELTY